MEVLSAILTIGTIIYHIISKISESSDNSTNNYSHSDDSYLDTYELSQEEKLESMNIDNLVMCYQSTKINHFSVKKVEQTFMNNYLQNDLDIKDVIIRKNCIYIKVMHSIPFKDRNKCYGASFSINYMEPNNCVSIYGSQKTNSDEQQAFKEIANELITTLSK
ncbi:hypothetical protein [Flavobacterium sp. ZB4P13]|uniref:hypothetical protein n=1 Tax=Flavobacterium sp. ZB4P13 TaxID=3401728 RepID=UPI003AAC28A6